MSKSQLKKELATMSIEQLQQIILDAYDARPETKEYFEFYLNPDIEKLMTKNLAAIDKEMRRARWSTSKGRVSVIKRIITNVINLNPGIETILDIIYRTIFIFGTVEKHLYLSDPQKRYVAILTKQLLAYGDKYNIMEQVMQKINDVTTCDNLSLYYRRLVIDAIESYTAEL